MSNELIEAVTRVTNSIARVPDRFSNPDGESIRTDFARIFGKCINAGLVDSGNLYLTLPFQASLLTDPVMYVIPGALVVLDHPTKEGQSEFAMDNVHIAQLSRGNSLYQDRYPRLILVSHTKKYAVSPSLMINRVMSLGFKGPFAEEIT